MGTTINGCEICHGDLPRSFVLNAVRTGEAAWDIETSGLDWREDRIASCQLMLPAGETVIVRNLDARPANLRALLADKQVRKVFHHAMFDLRFMSHHWAVPVQNIACTKIAAKLLDPECRQSHSLKSLVSQYLGVALDKSEQKSDWFASRLSAAQIDYAVSDVAHLCSLLAALEQQLGVRKLELLAQSCFAHIPTRVQLELLGYRDVYQY